MDIMKVVKWLAIVLIIVGAINWGLVGAFHFNAVAAIFGVEGLVTRIIYILVGVSGLYKIFLIATKR